MQQLLNHRATEKKDVLFDACTSVSADASASLSSPCSLQVSQHPPHQLPLASLLVLLLHLHLELCSFQLILSIFLGHKSLFVNRHSITTYLLPTHPPHGETIPHASVLQWFALWPHTLNLSFSLEWPEKLIFILKNFVSHANLRRLPQLPSKLHFCSPITAVFLLTKTLPSVETKARDSCPSLGFDTGLILKLIFWPKRSSLSIFSTLGGGRPTLFQASRELPPLLYNHIFPGFSYLCR